METPPAAATPGVAAGHIRLILSHSTDVFYLEIPTPVIRSNSVRPIKYLRFLGWCIMGILGTVKSDREGLDVADNALLQDQAIYFYVYEALDEDAALKYAVDLAVIKTRSDVSASDSSVHARKEAFKESLVQRDATCIFTSKPAVVCQGTHIIPFSRGDEFNLLVQNRPANPDEDVSTLVEVDDGRNGMLLGADLHMIAELRNVVVLNTPNLVLDVNDVPPHPARTLGRDTEFPDMQRYSLQWLQGDSPQLLLYYPNNTDAAFRRHTHIPRPSPALLHYNYGAAAVKWWGQGQEHLGISNRPTMPRPSVPVPAATGPTRTKRTGNASIPRRGPGNVGGSGSGPQDSEVPLEEEVIDADDVVMFLWAQNPAALERRKLVAEEQKREREERARRMGQWRESVVDV